MQSDFIIENDLGILQLKGDFNVVQVDDFRQKFSIWFKANSGVKNVVVDMSEVTMVDSAGLGVLIAIIKQVTDRGGEMNLCGLMKRVRMVFEITRTHKIFSIYDDLGEAKQAFK